MWYRTGHEGFLRNALRRHLATAEETIVYAQCPVSARAALRARRGPHQPVVMAVHFNPSQADEWVIWRKIKKGGRAYAAIRRMEADVIPRLDGIVYVCHQARDALTSWLPQANSVPSDVIWNFVEPVTASTSELGDLVTVGSIEKRKNHDYLLDVLAEANQMGHVFTLDIYGDGSHRAELERRIRFLGLNGQVRLRGIRRDVQTYLPGYRAYVHAAYYETFPFTIVEAMAASLPILAHQVAGIAECCDEGVEARFWPLDDPRKGARILIDLLSSEAMRSQMAVASGLRFRRQFSAEVLGPRLHNFLQSSLTRSEDVSVPQ